MRSSRLALLGTLLFLVVCGGVEPPAAAAQNWRVLPGTVQGPFNVVNFSSPATTGPTCCVLQVVPNSPVAGQATIRLSGFAAVVGQSITLSHVAPASSKNDGTYTVLAKADPQLAIYTIACSTCVAYADETGYPPPSMTDCVPGPCSMTFDGFPEVVVDANGVLRQIYTLGMGQQAVNPSVLAERTSTDQGATWTDPPAVLLADTSNACPNGNGVAANCSYLAGAIGNAPNGNLIIFAPLLSWYNSAIVKGLYYLAFNSKTRSWGPRQSVPQPSPDGSNFCYSYGNIRAYGNRLGAVAISCNLTVYMLWSSDNGMTWGSANQIGTAPNASPEMDCFADVPGGATNLMCVSRNDAAARFDLLRSSDGGVTWSSTPMSIGFSCPVAGTPELVAPWVNTGVQAGAYLMTHGERTSTCGNVVGVFFDPKKLFADPTAVGIPIVLDSSAWIPADCCYSSSAALGNGTVLATWYRLAPAPGSGWKIYRMTATFGLQGGMRGLGLRMFNGRVR